MVDLIQISDVDGDYGHLEFENYCKIEQVEALVKNGASYKEISAIITDYIKRQPFTSQYINIEIKLIETFDDDIANFEFFDNIKPILVDYDKNKHFGYYLIGR